MEGGDKRAEFQDIEKNPLTAIATLLDPRYKSSGFQNKEKAKQTKDQIILPRLIREMTLMMPVVETELKKSQQDEDAKNDDDMITEVRE